MAHVTAFGAKIHFRWRLLILAMLAIMAIFLLRGNQVLKAIHVQAFPGRYDDGLTVPDNLVLAPKSQKDDGLTVPASLVLAPKSQKESVSNVSKNLIMVFAYMRGGSTFLGSVISELNDSFYFYEPLWRLTGDGYYRKNLFCSLNHPCRKPVGGLEDHSVAMEIIKSLLSCNIAPVYGRLDRKVTLTDFANAQQRSFWNRCRNSQAESACIRSMETLCRNTSVLTTKVIRLGMDVAGDLLEALPKLKVIYLLRDPRGILRSSALYSRLQTWPPGTRSPAICGRMVHDVTTSQVLVQKYPDRFAIVRYEDLSLAPIQTTRLIYNFIGVEFSVADLNRVKYQTQADDQEETREGFHRKNASVTALRWRKEIHWRLVEETDVECRLIYNITGYRAAVSEDVLRDSSKSLISPPFSLTGVLYPGGVL